MISAHLSINYLHQLTSQSKNPAINLNYRYIPFLIISNLSISHTLNMKSKQSFALLMLIFLSSCVTQRKVEYFQDRNKDIKAYKEAEFPDYRLKANDELYIQINSLDEETASVFSNTGQDPYLGSMQPYGASLLSYSIDKDGYLLLPGNWQNSRQG